MSQPIPSLIPALWRRLLSAACILMLSACTADSDISGGPAHPAEATDIVAPLGVDAIAGDWQGVLSCGGRDFPVSLAVAPLDDNQLEVRWTVESALGRQGYVSPDGRTEIKDRLLQGEHDPITGHAAVLEQVQLRPLALQLLFGDDIALLGYQRCDLGLLQRAPANALSELQNELVLIQEPVVISAEDQQGECPKELQAWIQAGLDLPLDSNGRGDTSALWTAAVTQPIFGKPVAKLGAQQRIELRRALAGRCMVSGDRRQKAVVSALMHITDYRSFRDGRLIQLAQPLAQAWLADRAQPLLQTVPLPLLSQTTSQALGRIPHTFNFDRMLAGTAGYDARTYAQQMVAVNDALAARRREQDYLDNMRNARFFTLLELWQAALAREDIADAPTEALVTAELVSKAEAHIHQAATARDAAQMADWVAGVEAGLVCSEETQEACADAAELFTEGLQVLANQFAKDEASALATLGDQTPTLQNLAALVAKNGVLLRTYGLAVRYGDFPEVLEDYQALRFDWQRELEEALTAQLTAARTTSTLTALDARYFAASDLTARAERHLKRLGKVYDQQLSGSRPFVDTGADAYLNALYNQEFATLARMDAELLSAVAPVFRFMAQQINAISGLLGNAGRPLSSAARELNTPSAVTAVALRYLLDFEDQYAACLGPDAATITFTERVDSVTRTGNGIELSRIRGVPVSTTYRIKREHLDVFQDVFSRPESPGAEGVFEALFGLQKVNDLTHAVTELMDQHRCDSEAVQGFEKGLLAYYANRKGLWGR
ncbi:hypothetical protein [Haliea salexigens]|uniref:hypothetical protein n=1 Tax=Haliea salexigens TaxID=287487 RepID=UPI00040ECA0F|nr:hypothetical protein [Haliea salexigens]